LPAGTDSSLATRSTLPGVLSVGSLTVLGSFVDLSRD